MQKTYIPKWTKYPAYLLKTVSPTMVDFEIITIYEIVTIERIYWVHKTMQ